MSFRLNVTISPIKEMTVTVRAIENEIMATLMSIHCIGVQASSLYVDCSADK